MSSINNLSSDNEYILSKNNTQSVGSNTNIRIENEIEALQSIYLDNLKRVTALYEGHYEILIKLTPDIFSNLAKKPFCSIELKIKFPKDYPNDAPVVEIGDKYNITQEEYLNLKQQIKLMIEDYTEKNMEMIHEICQKIQKFLDDKNRSYEPQKKVDSKGKLNLRKNSSQEDLKKMKENYDNIKNFLNTDDKNLRNTINSNIVIDDSELGLNNLENVNNNMSSRFLTDFEVVDKIGQGGGGSVYKVKNKYDGMFYAIKRVI
jgi:hypothetical protein